MRHLFKTKAVALVLLALGLEVAGCGKGVDRDRQAVNNPAAPSAPTTTGSTTAGSTTGSSTGGTTTGGSTTGGSTTGGGTIVGCSASRTFTTPPIQRTAITHYGRQVTPLGNLTDVGVFPGGGALTRDGQFYWSVDTGKDINYVYIIQVSTGAIVQQLPLPGSGGHVVFSPDGKTAYVPGNPTGNFPHPASEPVMASNGDAIHVYAVDTTTGMATEQTPITIPSSANAVVAVGSSRQNTSVIASGSTGNSFSEWPEDIAISPDGSTLLTALLNSDRAAIINTATQAVTVVTVGTYPRGAAIERNGKYGYISNSYDGTLSQIDLASGTVTSTIALGLSGADISDAESHVLALAADPTADRLYATVANRDLVMVLDTVGNSFVQRIDLRRFGGTAGLGVSPDGLAVTPDGCTLYVANAYEDAIESIALRDRVDSATKAYDVIGEIPIGDYPTAVAVTPDGNTLVWLASKGMGTNKGMNGLAPVRIKQAWQRGIVGALQRPDDHFFAQMAPVVTANLTPDGEASPASTVVHGAQTGIVNGVPTYAASDQIKYVFLVVKENRTYDNILSTIPRGNGAPMYLEYEDNCGPANTAFEGPDRNSPLCGITPNVHALVRRYPLLTQFYANSEQSEEGHIFSTGSWLTDYQQRNTHWEPAGRGRPYDTGIYPIAFPPKYFIFDQVLQAGLTFRNYGEKSGGANPEPKSQGANRTLAQFLQVQANTSQEYPFNGLAACMTAAEMNPAPLFAGCIFDSGQLGTQSQLTGDNVPPPAGVSRFDIFQTEFSALIAAGQTPNFTYLIQFNDHGQGDTPNNTTEAAQAADNDLALGQLVQMISNSSIWPQTAIFVMEDDSQDGGDHVDSHRMPAYVISPWVKQGTDASNSPIIGRRYDQLSMLRTIGLILGLPTPSLLQTLSVPMYDVFMDPTATPILTPYTAILPERSLTEQVGQTPSTIAFAKNAPDLYALSRALPWAGTDLVPQELAERIHFANMWGDDRHFPGAGPNASPVEHARAVTALAIWNRYKKNPVKARQKLAAFLRHGDGDDD
jgi:YVTN family beta-propeller protein